MSEVYRPIPQAQARREHVLLDTADAYDAWNTGRAQPESADHGDGLQITYDGTGPSPSVSVYGRDGEIEFRGLPEIRAVERAMEVARRFAEAFGPTIPISEWRGLHG